MERCNQELARFRTEKMMRRTYGDIRPVIHFVFQGQQVVVVGSELLYSASWKTFTDFLFDYLKFIFGREWWESELKLPASRRHPVLHWSESTYQFRRSHRPNADGVCEGVPDGPTQAYVALAYDLYVLKDHNLLQRRLVQRLKNRDLFNVSQSGTS